MVTHRGRDSETSVLMTRTARHCFPPNHWDLRRWTGQGTIRTQVRGTSLLLWTSEQSFARGRWTPCVFNQSISHQSAKDWLISVSPVPCWSMDKNDKCFDFPVFVFNACPCSCYKSHPCPYSPSSHPSEARPPIFFGLTSSFPGPGFCLPPSFISIPNAFQERASE